MARRSANDILAEIQSLRERAQTRRRPSVQEEAPTRERGRGAGSRRVVQLEADLALLQERVERLSRGGDVERLKEQVAHLTEVQAAQMSLLEELLGRTPKKGDKAGRRKSAAIQESASSDQSFINGDEVLIPNEDFVHQRIESARTPPERPRKTREEQVFQSILESS